MAHAPPHALGDRLHRRRRRRHPSPRRKAPSRHLAPRLRRPNNALRLGNARSHPGLRSSRPLRRTSQPPLLPRRQATGRSAPRRAQGPREPPLGRSGSLPRPIRAGPGPAPDRRPKPHGGPYRLPYFSRVGPTSRPLRRSSTSPTGYGHRNDETNPISPSQREINNF